MKKHSDWSTMAPQVIYEAYPDHDLLPIDPPRAGETIREFKARAEHAGDTTVDPVTGQLFQFVDQVALRQSHG